MTDTHTLLLREVSPTEVQAFVDDLDVDDVAVTVHAEPSDYVDDLGLELSQYPVEVSLVGMPTDELRVGRLIRDKFPDSLLMINMQRVAA